MNYAHDCDLVAKVIIWKLIIHHELCSMGMLQCSCSDSRSKVYYWESLLPVNRKYKVQDFNIIKESDFEELDTKFTATVLVNVCEPSEANKHTSFNIHLISLPCSYKARLHLEPAYLQVLVHYLLSNCS